MRTDEYYMDLALELAREAADRGEVPVGAVIVSGDRVIAKAYNMTEALCDVTAHAEMQAITSAADFLGGKYLPACTLYVTLEPCPMCAGALKWSQIGRIVYGADDPKHGAISTSPDPSRIFHPKTTVSHGLRAEESRQLLQNFFRSRR